MRLKKRKINIVWSCKKDGKKRLSKKALKWNPPDRKKRSRTQELVVWNIRKYEAEKTSSESLGE